MIKLLIVTHGHLSEALKESAGMFFESAKAIETLSLLPENNPLELKDHIVKKLKSMELKEGVLIFVDLFAGTPSNMTALAITELPDCQIACFTGVNLPLIMETLAYQETMKLKELSEHLEKMAPSTILDLRKRMEL